jgi:hypothetical protein
MSGSIPKRSVLTCAWLLLAAMFAFLVPATSHAAEVRKAERVEVAASEIIDDNLIALAQTVIIDGHITGDAVVFASSVTIRGTIDGNLITAAKQVEIEGVVAGSVVTAGQSVYVGALQGSQLYAAGRSVTLDAVSLSGDAVLAGWRVDVSGSVGRDVHATGQRVAIEAELQRDLVVTGDDLYVGHDASIGHDLQAHVDDADDLVVAAGASINGSTGVFDDLDDSRFDDFGFYLREFLIPIAAVIVAVTLIGLPLALAALGWYAVALYLGKLLVAAEIGRRMLRMSGDKRAEVVLSLLLGLLILAVLVELPIVGGLLGFVLAVFGLGTVVNHCLAWNRRRKGQAVD